MIQDRSLLELTTDLTNMDGFIAQWSEHLLRIWSWGHGVDSSLKNPLKFKESFKEHLVMGSIPV